MCYLKKKKAVRKWCYIEEKKNQNFRRYLRENIGDDLRVGGIVDDSLGETGDNILKLSHLGKKNT